MSGRPALAWGRVYAGVALSALATLLLELALTRLYSVVLFYHFAFLAISVALFGLGAGALFSYYLFGRRRRGPVWPALGLLSLINMGVTGAALLLVLGRQVSLEMELANAGKLALIYLASAAPFFLAGTVISTAISESVDRVGRLYFFDLFGAAAGSLLLVPLLELTGGPGTVLAAAAAYGVAAAVWYSVTGSRRQVVVSLALAAALAVFVVVNIRTNWVDVRFAKGARLGPELFSRWNSFSRVAVKPDPAGPTIVIDADAATTIASYSDGLSPAAREELLRLGPGLPYQIRPGAKTLIIGPGGGYDVARALAGGASDVTGVEINPIIVNDVMKNRFADYSRRLYFRPEVRIHVEDGRAFVRRSKEKYQVIQMTLVDTWASTAAGAFALSENGLYTTEAFLDYLERLTDDGLLAVTRWEFDPPRESLRVVALGLEALRRRGAPEPWRHFLVCREDAQDLTGYGARDTVILKRTPFLAGEIAAARRAMREAKMPAVYLPDQELPNPFTWLLRAEDPARFAKEYQYDISPPSDNRPFFFYTVRLRELWRFAAGRSEDVKINMGMLLLFGSLAVSLAATAVILVLPPLLTGTRAPRERAAFVHLGYFFAIGVGFIMIEVSLIQHFVLFLGNPTYSLTVVVFSLLVSSGLGSYGSGRIIRSRDGRLQMALLGVVASASLLAGLLPPLLGAGVGLPVAAKCAMAAAVLTPPGFLMGMMFPSGLGRLHRSYPTAVRWAWAMNSASSVLGSVAAVFLSIHLGLAQTLFLGGATYLLALAAVRLTPAGRPEAEAAGAA